MKLLLVILLACSVTNAADKNNQKKPLDPAAEALKKLDEAPPPVEEKTPKKGGETVDYQTVPEKKKPEPKKFAPNDLNYWPYAGQVAGSTGLSATSVTIKNTTNNLSSDTSTSLLSQALGVGITNYIAAGIGFFDLISANGSIKTGFQSPVINLSVHSNPNETDQILSAGVSYSPAGSSDNYLRDDFQTFNLTYGKNNNTDRFKASVAYTKYSETDLEESQTLTELSVAYSNYFSARTFVNIGAGALNYSDEQMKFSNLKFKYATMPRITLGVGGNSENKRFGWQISGDYYTTKVVADSTVDTDLTYTGTSIGLTASYLF